MITKFAAICAAAGVVLAMSALGYAQSSGKRMPDSTPGQKIQDRSSTSGQSGASGHTPGHQMQEKGSRVGEPSASGYASGHQEESSTTGRGSMGNRDPDRGRGDER